jgi:hypothetical protein
MEVQNLIHHLEAGADSDLVAVYNEVKNTYEVISPADARQAQRDAVAAVVQGVHIREMKKLDKSTEHLARVGIWVALVGVILAGVQVWISLAPPRTATPTAIVSALPNATPSKKP